MNFFLNKIFLATYCKSVSAKRFEIGYDLVDGDKIEPVFSFTDLSVDKVKKSIATKL